MRLKKLLLLTTLSSSLAFSLTIDEAVEKAIANSNAIKQKSESLNIANYTKDQKVGAFLPKVNLSYGYYDRDHTRYSANSIDSSITAKASINLFNGLSDYYNLSSAKSDVNTARHYLKATTEDIILSTKVAYIDYLRAKEALSVQKESLTLLKKQFEDTKMHYNQGMVAKNDLLKVEVELLSIEQSLNRAISNLKIAKINLTKLIGVIDSKIEPIDTKNISYNYSDLTDMMYKNRSELKVLESQRESLVSKKSSLNSSFMPKVNLSTSYIRSGDEVNPDSLDERNIYVSASWNIYNGNSDMLDKKKYISQILSMDSSIDEMKKDLNLQLASSYEAYTLAISNLKIAKKATIQAQENYTIVENQFKQGIAKTSDTLDAREYLTRAKSEYNLAYFDMLESLYKVQRVVENR
jgi:outer membrane protein TolC